VDLWKLDQTTGSTPTNAFVDHLLRHNLKIIKNTILDTYDDKLGRNTDHIYHVLYQLLTYLTKYGMIILSNNFALGFNPSNKFFENTYDYSK